MFVLSSVIGMNRSGAQQFIRNYDITTTGVTQDWPVDINYHSVQDKYYSLHHSPNGDMPVMGYDGTTYASLGGVDLTLGGVSLDPQAMIHKNNGTAVLFNMAGNYGIVAYNNTTNAIIWEKTYTAATSSYSITVRDMVVDPSNPALYVVGDIYDNTSGRIGLYIAQINQATGAVNWHEQITNGVYDFASNTIFFSSTSDIYIAAGASNPSSILDRGAYVVDISSTGAINSSVFLKYNADCDHHRLSSPSVKRLNSDVYIFCPSVVGPDGSGNYFLAKFNSSLSTLLNYHIYFAGSMYFYNFVAPKFEFVNNDQNIMVSGTRSLLNSSIPGYIHAIYDLNTAFVSAYNYQYESVGTYSSAIVDCYNANTDDVFSAAQDYGTPAVWYGLRSGSFGNIDPVCDTVYDQDSVYCDLLVNGLDVSKSYLHSSVTNITMKIKTIGEEYDESCTHVPCIGCELAGRNNGGLKAVEDKSADWSVYPNPASSVLEISYSSEIRTIIVTDIKGQKIKTLTGINAKHYALELNDLPEGMYFINASGADEQTINRKFVKE